MSIFSMVLRLCISHTHSIEAFLIWDVLRRLVVVPGIDVRLGCQADVMGILAAAIARAPAHFNVINRAMAHGSDRQAAPVCSPTVYMVSAALTVVGSATGTP